MKWPKRKLILKEKRREKAERQKMIYSDIARKQGNVNPQQIHIPHYTSPLITKYEALKIHICM